MYFLNANIFKCFFSPFLYANCTSYSHMCGSLLNLFRTHFLKNSSICLNQWFSTGVAFGPQETSGNVLTFLVVTADGWGRMLLALYGQRTERQGSIQECTVHPKTSKHYSRSAGNPNKTQAPTKNKQREQAL